MSRRKLFSDAAGVLEGGAGGDQNGLEEKSVKGDRSAEPGSGGGVIDVDLSG